MFPTFLLDSDDDWQESLRRWLYPLLHPYLKPHGGYALGNVTYNQFVGSAGVNEDVLEDDLVDLGFRRNPLAALKSLPDGRTSEGSWVLLADDSQLIEPGMQLHITIFQREDGKPGREIYAHYEDDWRENPSAHVKGDNLSSQKGVEKARELFEDTYMVID